MIKIITDTASDILPSEATKLGIKSLPLTITFNKKDEYIDGVTITPKEFCEKLVESPELPKTSQITPFAFEEAFKECGDDDVICICLSKKLSGTYNSARLVAQDFPNVRVIDSNNVTLGERIIVLRAIQLVEEGKTADEVVATIEAEKDHVHCIGLVETLEFLKKGGRISTVAALFGSLLNIKPVVEVDDGEIKMFGKARGSLAANNKLRERVALYGGVDFSRPSSIGYTGLDETVMNKYMQDSKDLYPEGHVFDKVQIGSTVGTHVGPGAVAVAFFSYKARKDVEKKNKLFSKDKPAKEKVKKEKAPKKAKEEKPKKEHKITEKINKIFKKKEK